MVYTRRFGYGANVFMILSECKNVLKDNGDSHLIDEMVEQVTNSQSYDEAIHIMEEYIGEEI